MGFYCDEFELLDLVDEWPADPVSDQEATVGAGAAAGAAAAAAAGRRSGEGMTETGEEKETIFEG